MSEERQQSYIDELKRCVKEDCDFYLEHNEVYEFNNYIKQLQQENEQLKKELAVLRMSEEEWLDLTIGREDYEGKRTI